MLPIVVLLAILMCNDGYLLPCGWYVMYTSRHKGIQILNIMQLCGDILYLVYFGICFKIEAD